MKRSLLLIAVGFIISSCGNEGGVTVQKKTTRDTSYPLALYLGYQLKGLQQEVVRKVVIKDTAMWVGKDSSTMKKEYSDSVYYNVSVMIPIRDSQSSVSFGLPWKNKDTVITRLLYASPMYVREFPGYDSALAQLKRLMDTTKQKVDTTKK